LSNPNLDNTIFGLDYIQQCKSLEHLEIGGLPNHYLGGITFENGIEKLTHNDALIEDTKNDDEYG